MLDTEKQKLHSFVADRHQWLCKNQRKRTRRFLFNASCLIFFYYYVQRFFYTKKLNAVLINSVCSFYWGSSKSEDFVRNSANFFFFLKFFETFDSLCLQWNHTPWQLVDYIFFHLLNLHSTIFIFCQKIGQICLKSEMLCSIWCICPNFFHRIRNPPLDSTLHLRLVRMTCKSVVLTTTEVKILNVDRVSFENHQRCLLPSPAQRCPFGTVPRA